MSARFQKVPQQCDSLMANPQLQRVLEGKTRGEQPLAITSHFFSSYVVLSYSLVLSRSLADRSVFIIIFEASFPQCFPTQLLYLKYAILKKIENLIDIFD